MTSHRVIVVFVLLALALPSLATGCSSSSPSMTAASDDGKTGPTDKTRRARLPK